MRIIAGRWRGLRLAAVGKGDAAAHLRPTADRVRESLFNVLGGGAFGDPLGGAVVLDLFSGTGALGLEAVSRGADQVTFVENGRKGATLITENIRLTGAGGAARLLRRDATRLPACPGPAADLVFLDPPYGKDLGAKALRSAVVGGWISSGALLVWEEAGPQNAPDGFTLRDTRRYGDTHVTFLSHP